MATGDNWTAIGAAIRRARVDAKMSLRELARRVGVAPSHVSQAERGIGSFSVSTLYAVATELSISLDSLFEPAVPAASLRTEPASSLDGTVVLRAGNRAALTLKNGPRWERLTAASEPDIEFLEVIYAPHAEPSEPEFSTHDGIEYGVVISGVLTVEIEDERTQLHPGDTIRLESSRPHRYWNEGRIEVRAIWLETRGGSPERVPEGT